MRSNRLETEEDLRLVKEYLLLPWLLDAVERDKKLMQAAGLKFNQVYLKQLDQAQDAISKDLYEIRKQMREQGLKVYEQERGDIALQAKYLCRGYHHRTSMLWTYVYAELKVRLAMYLDIDIRE